MKKGTKIFITIWIIVMMFPTLMLSTMIGKEKTNNAVINEYGAEVNIREVTTLKDILIYYGIILLGSVFIVFFVNESFRKEVGEKQ